MSTLFHLTSPNGTTPSAANSIQCVPSGTAWTFGAYATVLVSTPADTLLLGVSALVQNGFSSDYSWEIELATGPSGSEVTIATFAGVGIDASQGPQHHLTLPAPIKVPAGTRIASRIRKSTTDTNAGQIDLITVPTTYTGTLYPTAAVVKCVPYGSDVTATCSATAWVNGAVAQLTASMPTDAVIFALKSGPTGLGWNGEFEIDLLTGASGSEVPVSGVRGFHAGMDEPGWHELPAPVFVAAGTRLSVRFRASVGAADGILVGAMYYAAPGTDYPSDLLATAAPVFAPAAANATAVTSGAPNTFGPWVQVIASASQALALVDAVVDTVPVDGHIQVGTGASGSETPIATLGVGGTNGNVGSVDGALPVPVALIASGQRVAIRYVTNANASSTNCALVLLPTSGLSALQTTAQPSVMPTTCDLNGVSVIGAQVPEGASSWASGAWTQITSGNANPGALYAIGMTIPITENQFEVDVGVGASGSEVVIYTFRSVTGSSTGGRFMLMADALIPFAASTRVAVRLRVGATGGGNAGVAIYYYDNLVFVPPAIVGSGAVGYKAKVTNTLAWLFNLDGTARTNSTSGLFMIGGALNVTGLVRMTLAALSGLLDGIANTLGDLIYRGTSQWTRLAGNLTTTRQFLSQTGTGSASAAPAWAQVADSDLSLSNITTNDVSTTKHGFAPKAPNDATKFLDGTGAYSVPAGSGGGGGSTSLGALVLLASFSPSAAPTQNVTTRNATGQSGAIIQSDFDDYLIEFANVIPATANVDLYARMSTNGGTSYDSTNLYATTALAWNSGGSAAEGNAVTAPNGRIVITDNLTQCQTDANYGISGFGRLINPGGAGYKRLMTRVGFKTGTTLQAVESDQVYQNTTAVNAFQFFFSTGNIASGTIRIYGIAKTASLGPMTVIAEVTTTGSQATVDFASIPASYKHLRVVYTAQDTQAGTSSVPITIKVNADATAGDYTATSRAAVQNAAALLSDVAASASGAYVGIQPQSGNTGIVASGDVLIPNYAGTTFHKRFHAVNGCEDGTNNGTVQTLTGRWKSTAAITELTFLAGGTAFKDGSVFTLYGLQ